ncbi:MAG TPA: UDP-N-acetylmuramate--L-alanine ligase, partial [Acidimicrobiales bacterium]|nr:UDP-N-acetylmuramate--L-alanine ligase [Acidimicrobiales bacterium]
GIGGAGMSAIATVLAAMGHHVSGSDLKASAGLERLRALGIDVTVGHRTENVGAVDVVAVSTAVPSTNPELVAARDRGINVVGRAQILAAIAARRRTIAVAGTHGKTTTSSMVAMVLRAAGVDPSFIVGGDVNEIGGGAAWTAGEWFVVEADESDGTFLELPAEVAIVTSVEADHLDHYGSAAAIAEAFARFLHSAPCTIVCADDAVAARLGAEAGAVTYGTSPDADYRIDALVVERAGARFRVVHDGAVIAEVSLPIPGAHNARNATAAVVTAVELGADLKPVVEALARFGGVARRFQFRGEAGGVTVVDDYAHNPGKLRAVLDAAGHGGWRRVVCVFQPHLYSRTAAQGVDLGAALARADVVVVTDVYGARESPKPGVTGMIVAAAAIDARPWRRLAYLPHRGDIVPYLHDVLRPGDLCLTLGAGDITSLADDLIPMLASRTGR